MYGPTGVGFLYGKRDLLEALPPANFGGSMVELAYMDHEAQYMAPPARFEAGTQPVAQVVAAGVAAEWMMNIGLENIEAHEKTIAAELLKLGDVDGIRILGPRENVDRIGTVAFDVAGVHPHDVGQFIDAQGIDAYTSIFGFEIMFGVIGCICLVMLLRTIKKHFGAESVDKTEEAEATEIAGGEATI